VEDLSVMSSFHALRARNTYSDRLQYHVDNILEDAALTLDKSERCEVGSNPGLQHYFMSTSLLSHLQSATWS